MTKVAVLVPRRADGGRRDQVWDYIRATRWDGYDLFEGHDDGEWFNRSAAINRAAKAAGDWDVAVIADADSFVGHEQLDVAIDGCLTYGKFWLGYSVFHYLTRDMSDRIMDGYVGDWEPGVRFTMHGTCSSMVIVRRDIWEQAHGFDEFFVGWGWEDVAFSHMAQTFGGGLARASGPCWHLWHPPSQERSPENDERLKARAERYHQAHGDTRAMTALLDELGR